MGIIKDAQTGLDVRPRGDIPIRVNGWYPPGGVPAAAIADLDGDGQLEIMVQTFDRGLDIFTVPGSGCDCLLWTTAPGGPLRTGQPSGFD